MTQFLNSVKLREEEFDRLIGRLDVVARCEGGVIAKQGHNRRDDPRLSFRRYGIPIVLRSDNRSDNRSLVCSRNISRGGVGLVHGSFVHPGTTVEIYLPLLDETWLRASGTIVFCRHLIGKLHELGCRFDEPVPLEMLVDVDAAAQAEGGILGDELQDRRILIVAEQGNTGKIKDQLAEAGAEVFITASLDEAVSNSRKHAVELILLDYQTARRDPGPAVARLRAERCRQMIAVFGINGSVDPNGSAESWHVDFTFVEGVEFNALIEGVAWVLAHALNAELVD